MKKFMTLTLAVASMGVLSACDSVGDGYVDTQPPYNETRSVAPAPAPMAASAPTPMPMAAPEPAPMPAPAPAPMRDAEPVFEQHVTK